MITLALAGFAAWVVTMAIKHKDDFDSDYDGLCTGAIVVAIISLIPWLVAGCIGYISGPINLERVSANIAVYERQAAAFESMVRSELDRYPEYEKAIINSVDPNILLRYPELKANETLVAGFNSMLQYKSLVYASEIQMNGIRASMKLHRILFFIL